MVDFIPAEKASAIRQPSTANFLIDSYDGVGNTETAGNFQITKKQSLLNGFFTRLGATELALEWNVPNVISDLSYNSVFLDVSGSSLVTPTVTVPVGNYTAAEYLQTFVALYNALPSVTRAGTSLAITTTGGLYTLAMTGGAFKFPAATNTGKSISYFFPVSLPAAARVTSITRNTSSLNPGTAGGNISRFGGTRPPKYLDFVCSELTYNQALKDASTGSDDRDVIVRFYMAYTNDANQQDALGFPILMGYKPFYIRREFNPPKQIRWTANQPIGNLRFQVYDDLGNLYDNLGFDWKITIQVSEV